MVDPYELLILTILAGWFFCVVIATRLPCARSRHPFWLEEGKKRKSGRY